MNAPWRTQSRRQLIIGFVSAGSAIWLARGARGAASSDADGQRLELVNIHTGEAASVTIRDVRNIDPPMRAQLEHILRDYRANEQHELDVGLYAQLIDLARAAGCEARYDVISGYRSPATNAHLRAAGHGVAEHSLHMEGRAIDVRLKGCPLSRLHELALAAKRGGVGYYPRSNFVHIDTGRVRSWEE